MRKARREDAAVASERIVGTAGGVSGVASILGSWQVCHSVCLGLIALLGIMGITLTGMPLGFLTGIAPYMWLLAVALLGVLVVLAWRKRCVPTWMLLVNGGLIIAGTPFVPQSLLTLAWVAGGLLVIGGVVAWYRNRSCLHCSR